MYTVVVADDEEELRRALIRKVDWQQVGFEVVGEAENGVEALELVEKFEPDLLLTDIKMPYITGLELARQVREVRPTTQIAFLSGYDDFAYAQQAIQYNIISYLLKPISAAELTEELNKIRIKIDDKFQEFANQNTGHMEISEFLMPLILDGQLGETGEQQEQALLQEAVLSGLLKDKNNDFRYTIMITSISDSDGKNCTTTSTVNAIDMILRKYVRHSSFYANGKVVSLLMATSAGYEKYLHILVEDISQSMKRILNRSCVIGVSRQMPKMSMLHEAYSEAMNALGYSRQNRSSVHFISDLVTNESLELDTIQGYLGEIETLIRGSSKENLQDCLERIFYRLEEEHISPIAVQFLLTQLVSEVLRIVYAVSEGEGISELQKKIPPQDKLLTSINGMRDSYLEFCMSARDMIAEQRKKSSTVICDRALELIENKYMDQDLSLVMVSNEISVSPNYLSALVKKSTGSNFVDLLTRKRIAKAKELLLCSSMKIREISELCGYNDQHYFSYCFKKVTGVSPNSMRHDDQKNSEE